MSFYNFTIMSEGKEIEICVEYRAVPGRPATHMDPAEPAEIQIQRAWVDPDGDGYEPSEERAEKWAQEILENHDFSDQGDDGI